jgi:hypothetical protein
MGRPASSVQRLSLCSAGAPLSSALTSKENSCSRRQRGHSVGNGTWVQLDLLRLIFASPQRTCFLRLTSSYTSHSMTHAYLHV